MSSTLPPPPPPPSGPGGPSGGPPPEYLESGGGQPPPREPRSGSGLKKALLVGGGALGLAAAGVGAWAAYNFIAAGPQPAEALPATTLGYVSVDLDPSGGQKIEALRTLNKFPAFEDAVGIDADDDLRKAIFDLIQEEAACEGLDYEDDVEPWLGDRAAMAAVDNDGDTPLPVVVVQVKDADKADAGLDAIKECGGGGEEGGWVIEGDWALITESEDAAREIADAAADGSLADDEEFQRWTGEAGDAGVMTMYAGPAAGDYFADHADELNLLGLGGQLDVCGVEVPAPGESPAPGEVEDDPFDDGCADGPPTDDVPDAVKEQLREFRGMAATVRFDDGAIELEVAGDGELTGASLLSGGGTADVVQSLPASTALAYGLGFEDGWFSDLVDFVAPYTGQTADELMEMLSEESGLELPDDAETLAGDSATLAVGSDFDPEALFGSPDGSDVPVAVKIEGEPDEIESVLDKLREMAGSEAGVLDSDSDGDTIVIGPNADFRAEVLEDGGLGDDEVFRDVVREADEASTILFVNVNRIQDAIEELEEGDDEFLANVEPISGFGLTGWVDDDVAHGVLRLTTD